MQPGVECPPLCVVVAPLLGIERDRRHARGLEARICAARALERLKKETGRDEQYERQSKLADHEYARRATPSRAATERAFTHSPCDVRRRRLQRWRKSEKQARHERDA